MAKGNYQIYTPSRRQSRDTTKWKTYTCEVLIFGVICLLLILMALTWKTDDYKYREHSQSHHSGQYGDKRTGDVDVFKDGDSKLDRIVEEDGESKKRLTKHDEKVPYKPNNEKNPKKYEQVVYPYNDTDRENIYFDYSKSKSDTLCKLICVNIKKGMFNPNEDESKLIYNQCGCKSQKFIKATPGYDRYTTLEITKGTTIKHTSDNIFKKHETTTNHYLKENKHPTKGVTTEYTSDISTTDMTTTNDFSTENHESIGSVSTEGTTTEGDCEWLCENKMGRHLKYCDCKTTDFEASSSSENYETAETTKWKFSSSTDNTYNPDDYPISTIGSYSDKVSEDCDDTCKICKANANDMFSLIEKNVDPCKDIYTYACSGIVHKPKKDDILIDVINNQLEMTSINEKKIYEDFRASCLNYDPRVNCLSHIRNSVNGISKFSVKNLPSLMEIIQKLLLKDTPIFFDLRVEIDRITKKNVLVMYPVILEDMVLKRTSDVCDPSVQKTAEKKYYDLNKVYDDHNRNTVDNIVNMTVEALTNVEVFNGLEAKEKIRKIEKSLRGIFETLKGSPAYPINNNKKCKNPIEMTPEELTNKFKGIKWNDLISRLLQIRQLPDGMKLKVHHIDYLTGVFELLKKTPRDELHDDLLALYVHKLFRKFLLNELNLCDKKRHCFDVSNNLMEDIHSALYLESVQNTDMEKGYSKVKDLFDKIKRKAIAKYQYSQVKDKEIEVLKKLNLLTLDAESIHFGKITPPRYKSIKLENDGVTNKYVENTENLVERKRKFMYSSYQLEPLSPEYIWLREMLPYERKPKLIRELDVIVVPHGILEKQGDFVDSIKVLAELGFELGSLIAAQSSFEDEKTYQIQMSTNITLKVDSPMYNQETTMILNSSLSEEKRETSTLGVQLARLVLDDINEPYVCSEYTISEPVTKLAKEKIFFTRLAQNMCTRETIYDEYDSTLKGSRLHPLIMVNSMMMYTPTFPDAFFCQTPTPKLVGGMTLL